MHIRNDTAKVCAFGMAMLHIGALAPAPASITLIDWEIGRSAAPLFGLGNGEARHARIALSHLELADAHGAFGLPARQRQDQCASDNRPRLHELTP